MCSPGDHQECAKNRQGECRETRTDRVNTKKETVVILVIAILVAAAILLVSRG
jgi:hypothetical protein